MSARRVAAWTLALTASVIASALAFSPAAVAGNLSQPHPSFPIGTLGTAPPSDFPSEMGPIRVVLPAIESGVKTDVADVPIDCSIDLTQYVHYSVKQNDTSWHWKWSCDGEVELSGGQALYDYGYPVVTGRVASAGTSGTENIRYDGCVSTDWWGSAYGTFTSPNHGPASFEGSSPTNLINCP